MNRQEVVDKIAKKAGIEPKVAEKALGAFMNVVKDTLADGENVQLVGFGTFEVRERAARTSRNPHTGEPLHIAACKAPCFKAGKRFKEIVNN